MSFETDSKFAYELLTLIDNVTDTSILFSPFSILTGMTMFYTGTKEETEKEIAAVIGNDKSDKSEIIEAYSKLINRYKNDYNPVDNSDVKVTVANKLFVSNQCKLLSSFCETMDKKFNGGFKQIDFDENDAAAFVINQTVSNATNGQIDSIVEQNDIDSSTSLLLVNALHFIAPWKETFCERRKQMFQSTSPREIEMMWYTIMPDYRWNLIENEKWDALGIPYKDFKAWMYIVLPKENSSLKELLENMNHESFQQWTKRELYPSMVSITLPIMDISYDLELTESLKKLGVRTAFTDSCNLGEMTEAKTKLNKVLHKSHIKVDENGTEASAVTSYLIRFCCGVKKFFVADRPFLYFITSSEETMAEDQETASKPLNILFVGTFC